MASEQNDNVPEAPLRSPPTTADSRPATRQPDVGANTFSGGAESQVHRGNPPKRRTAVEARKSRYRGVQWDKNGGRWRARLHTDRTRHIGYFELEEDAAMAWDLALLRYFGEDEGRKKLNFGEVSIKRYRQEPNAQLQAINSRAPGAKHFRGPNDKHADTNPQGPGAAPVPAYRGVVPHEAGLYRSVVMKNRVNVTVGIYGTAEEAARAHDCASIQANGWGALTNFPLADYENDAQGRIMVHLPIKAPVNLQECNTAGGSEQQRQQQQAAAAAGVGLPRSGSWYGVLPTSNTGAGIDNVYGNGGNTGRGGHSNLPPLHRQPSLPATIGAAAPAPHTGGTPYHMRANSISSADLSLPPPSMIAGGGHMNQTQYTLDINQHQRTGSVTNLHQLAAAAMAGFTAQQQPQQPLPPFHHHHHQSHHQQQQQQQQVLTTTTESIPHMPVYLMNQPADVVNPLSAGAMQVQQQQQQQQTAAPNSSERKRSRAEIEDFSKEHPTTSRSTGATTVGNGTGKRTSPLSNNNNDNTAAAGASTDKRSISNLGGGSGGGGGGHNTFTMNTQTTANNPPASALPVPHQAAVAGVRQIPETGQYQAALYLNLGTFGSYDEAVRAYDRAALMSSGFYAAKTHVPLLDAVNRAATAVGGGPPQLLPAGVTGLPLRYQGVTLRGGSFLASLDIGGKAYELGPFATELDAAKAFDRYSLLLKGVSAATNCPPWEHLASAAEVGAIIDAVEVVAMASNDDGKNADGGNVPNQTVNQTPQQQEPLVAAALGGSGGNGGGGGGGGGSGLLTHSSSGGVLASGGQPQPLPLLSPMVRASSDLERLQSQVNELQAQALMQQQQVQQQINQQQQQLQQQQQQQQQVAQQHQHPALMFNHPSQATVPLNEVLNNDTLPMRRVTSAQVMHQPPQQHTAALAAFPSAGNLALPTSISVPELQPPTIQQQQQLALQLPMPTTAGITPPPNALNQYHQPAKTTAASSPPIIEDQQQHTVSAAAAVLAAATDLGQEIASAPVSAAQMPLNLPPQTAAQAAAQSHDEGMMTRTHSMAALAVAAVATAAATTGIAAPAAAPAGHVNPQGEVTQDAAGTAAGGAGGTSSTAADAGRLTPPLSAFEGGGATLSGAPIEGDLNNNINGNNENSQQQQQPPAIEVRSASMAAAAATLAADAAVLAVAADPMPSAKIN